MCIDILIKLFVYNNLIINKRKRRKTRAMEDENLERFGIELFKVVRLPNQLSLYIKTAL